MKIDNARIGTKDYGIVAEVIAQDCYKLRKWEPSRSPKFIVDVGCQIGCFSALASHIYKEACVLSFEMMRDNYDLAEKNLSKFKNNKCFSRRSNRQEQTRWVFLKTKIIQEDIR